MKKGQGATEYLIILAVVIIIALIVVGVMGGIPGIGGGAGSRTSASYWASADVALTSYAVGFNAADNNLVNMTVKNNLRNQVTVNSLSLDGSQICSDKTLAAGAATSCNAPGMSFCTASGNAYSLAVSINYTDSETGAEYIFTGDNTELEGTCAE